MDGRRGAAFTNRIGSFEQTHHLVFGDHRAPPLGTARVEVGRDWTRSYSRARMPAGAVQTLAGRLGLDPDHGGDVDDREPFPRHQPKNFGVSVPKTRQRGQDKPVPVAVDADLLVDGRHGAGRPCAAAP